MASNCVAVLLLIKLALVAACGWVVLVLKSPTPWFVAQTNSILLLSCKLTILIQSIVSKAEPNLITILAGIKI